MSDGGVATRFKMLTYYRVRSAFEPDRALPSNIIWDFQTGFNYLKYRFYEKAFTSQKGEIPNRLTTFFLDTPGAFLYIPLLIPKTYTVYEIIILPK